MQFLDKLFKRKPKIERVDLRRRFDLIARVGQGSMSKVWRSVDVISGRTVAVKVLDRAKTLRLERRFVGLNKPTEGEIAITLRHPHIVKTIEHGITTDDEQYLVMEFVEGKSLSYFVDAQNKTMQRHRLNLIVQLGQALEYLHREKWIHRDICPRNILVTAERQLKLIDFGLVVPNTDVFRAPGNRTGTANYMAPELIMRHRTDERIDLFSYAVTCYEMYANRLPWPAGDTLESVLQHINKPPEDIRAHRPEIDDDVAETIMKGLEREPDDRWSSATDMVRRFAEARERLESVDGDGQ